MTTPQRKAEAERASAAFHIALTQIGAATVEEALALWEEVPPSARPAAAAAWLGKAVTLVMTRRARSRDLALAYYRLVRALRTGSTIADPRKPEPQYVSLDTLRSEFTSLARAQSPQETPSETPPTEDTAEPQEGESEQPREESEPSEDDEVDRILVEEIERLAANEREIERRAEQEARTALTALGPVNQMKILQDVDPEDPASDVDAARDEAHLRAGARQAAAAERIAMDGARSELWVAMDGDQRCIGYVRLSRTGTPCGWCAMLISRGPVYRSEKAATLKGGAASYDDGDKYHDNCHCYAEPVYSREQFDGSSMYELNRKYAEEWPRVTQGLSGKAALTAWRRFVRQEQKSIRAQAARSTTNVQEA